MPATRAACTALCACALGLGTLAGAAAGGGSSPPAGLIASDYQLAGTISGDELVAVPLSRVARLASPAWSASHGGPKQARIKLSYYIGAQAQTVAPGGAQLFEIGCPVEGEKPVTGGAFAPLPGLVIVNSSRTNPQPGLPTAGRAWYEAVVNITAAPLDWKPFVTCARSK